ncbi:MAG: OmpH family outer membrane protein [Phycisphaerae bacterium]
MSASRTYALVTVVLLGGAVLLTDSIAQTARPAGIKIAVCDFVDVFNNYTRAKEETAKLNERRQQIKAEMDKREKALDALKLERDSYKGGSKKFKEVAGQVVWQTLQNDVWLRYQDALALDDHRELTEEMYQEIKAMIAQVAKQRGVVLVLQREPDTLETQNTAELLRQIHGRKVLYSADELDITETVLLSLNQAYKAKKPATRPAAGTTGGAGKKP